jgi:hypothetical protein
MAAIDSDISGPHSHARSLDADTKGVLRNIHRRVATTILFESSGGQIDKVAHLPELRFALGEPEIDTTSVDTVLLFTLEDKSYFNACGVRWFQNQSPTNYEEGCQCPTCFSG